MRTQEIKHEPIIAAEPTIEDRFAAFAHGEQDEEQAPEAEPAEGEQGEPAQGDDPEAPEAAEDAPESEAEELPPIAAPVSYQAWRLGLPLAGKVVRATASISTPAAPSANG